MTKALGLLSGGLDSLLACRLLMDQSIEVLGLSFVTPFFGPAKARQAARQLQIPLEIIDLTGLHWNMLKNPRHGFGKHLNPCIDCHALMLQEAGKLLGPLQADFLFTGEVLGQRPFSQTGPSLRAVEKTSGYADLILRPLSARLLPETRPEREGLVDRSRLLDLRGRSRKLQLALAARYGLKDFPNPAGGCLLTDPIFTRRLKELWEHAPDPDLREVELLKIGRHFRLPSRCKVVVGRNQKENELLEDLTGPEDGTARTLGFPGPLTLTIGPAGPDDWERVARLTAAYSDGPMGEPLAVQLTQGDRVWNLRVPKLPKETFTPWIL